MRKHSVTIRGHATSLSIEDCFWHGLKAIAAQRSLSLANLIAEVDDARAEGQNLSSALRVFAFQELCRQEAPALNHPERSAS